MVCGAQRVLIGFPDRSNQAVAEPQVVEEIHMKILLQRKFVQAFFLFSISLFSFRPMKAQDTDLTAKYQWKPVQVGAGGWMRGLAVAPTGTAAYARGDVDNVYRWSSAARQWYPTKIFSAIPSAYTGAPVNAGGGAIAIDPSNSNHVLVVFTLSGSADLNNFWGLNVFYSTDGAATYQAANLSLSGSLSQETTGERLAIDPNNGNVAYLGPPGAGTGNGNPDGLQRSLDGGATWTQVAGSGLPVSTSSLRYEFQLPRIDGGSGTATTGGQTASKIVYVTYIKHDETNNDNVIGGGVLKSADGGNTWTDITGAVLESGTSAVGFATIDTVGNLWIADGGNNNLYEWARTGSTWTTSYPTYGGGGGIAVDPKNPQRIFGQGNSSIARSLNGGASWTDLGPMQFAADQTISWLDPSSFRPQGHYVSVSGLYFDASGTLWIAGANDGIMNYTPSDADTSTTWTSISEGIEEAVAEPSVIPPGGIPVLTVEDETLFTITDPDTYTAQHFPLNTWNSNNGLSNATDSSYAPNQPKYVVELSTNMVAGNPLVQSSEYSGYSTDGGVTWQVFPSIAAGTHPCILYGGSIAVSARAAGHESDPAGADNLVWIPSNFNDFAAFGHGPAPFYSKDGGATWTQTASFDSAPGATQRTECPSNTSYTYTDFQWGPWVFPLSQHLLVADPVTPGTFYVHMTAGGFWKSTDGGVTWTQEAATNSPGYPQHGTLAAVPGVSGDLWLVDGHEGATAHGLYHTLDGGNTFARSPVFDYAWALALGKAAPGQTYPAIYVDGLYHGDSNWGIFQSIDGGATFNRVANYPDGILDIPNTMTASWDVFGTVYIGFDGNTFYYGAYSDTVDAPGAPILSATASDMAVHLSWSPAYPGGTPTSYSIYRGTATGQESTTPIATVDGSTYAYQDSGLTDGTTYYYYIVGTNGIGTGPNSIEASATPTNPVPAPPTSLTVFPGDGQLELTWAAAPTATSYNIFRGLSSGAEAATPVATGLTSTYYVDMKLTDGTAYYYQVQAVNSTGPSPKSVEAQGTPEAATASDAIISPATTTPALDGSVSAIWSTAEVYPMANLVGTIPTGQSNSATWQGLWDTNNLYILVNVQDSAALMNNDSVEVYVDGNNGKNTSYTDLDWQFIFQYGTPQVEEYQNGSQGTNISGITYGQAATTAGYRIVAAIPWSTLGVPPPAAGNLLGIDVALNNFYVAGSRADKLFWNSTVDQDWENPSLFGTAQLSSAIPTLMPNPAFVLTAQAVSGTEIDLSWTAITAADVSSYNVYRGTGGGGSETLLAGIPTGTTFADTTVTQGTTYYYEVTAVNGHGTEVYLSNQASATATQPALSLATGNGNTSATVTAGDTAVFNLTLNSTNYTGTVTYTCTGAPAGDVCSVTPSPLNLTPATTSSQVVVTVQTAAKTAMLERQSSVFLSMLTWAGAMLCAPLWMRRKRFGAVTLILLAAAMLITVSGCGGNSKPQATTSTLTLTAAGTGGVAPTTTTLTLTVQ